MRRCIAIVSISAFLASPALLSAERVKRHVEYLASAELEGRMTGSSGEGLAAEYLAEVGIQTLGVDYLSVGAFKADGAEIHRAILGAGIWVIEGLNLTAVSPGRVELVCLPLRIDGAEGAPARVILRPLTVAR